LIKEEEDDIKKGVVQEPGMFFNVDSQISLMQEKMKEAEEKALEDFNNLKITVANPVTAI
jgi:hypothetical protein